MSEPNFLFASQQPSVASTDDLFICGKCRSQFTDLNLFLVHRSNCPIGPSSPSTTLLCSELDEIIREVNLTPVEANPFYPPTTTSDAFDELFPPTTITETANQTLENELSQMSLLECPVCDEQFDAPIVLENHVFEHSTVDDSSSSYVDLLDEQPPATPLECKQCTVTFTSNASLNIHKKIFHCLNPVFRCLNDACAQLFDKPVDYILHARVHSQKRVRRSTTYRRHRKRTYRCRICKKLFSHSEQLQNHLTNETHKFLCQLCPAEFDSNNSYHNHLARHSNGAVYRCTICIESFQKRHDLSRHVLTKHNQELPKQKSCDSCKLTFKTTFHLNRHNNTKHSDVKPFKCEENGCDEAFARKDKLKQHAAKHTAQGGMFQCQACWKTFVRPEHLRDHDIVRHSRQYPFRCEYCGKGFLHQTQLYQHHKQRHSTENQQMKEEEEGEQFNLQSTTNDWNENSSEFFF